MTMPAINYIEHECTMQCDPDCNTQGASYIRADLADELALALDDARANILGLINSRSSEAEGSDSDWVGDIDAILFRYISATGGCDRA